MKTSRSWLHVVLLSLVVALLNHTPAVGQPDRVAWLQKAMYRGGLIPLEAGSYDLRSWPGIFLQQGRPVTLYAHNGPVRMIGAGQNFLNTAGVSIAAHDIEFEGWNRVVVQTNESLSQDDVVIQNCTFTNCRSAVFMRTSQVHGMAILDCHFTGSVERSAHCVWVISRRFDNTRVLGNTIRQFRAVGTFGGFGFDWLPGSYPWPADVEVRRNTAEDIIAAPSRQDNIWVYLAPGTIEECSAIRVFGSQQANFVSAIYSTGVLVKDCVVAGVTGPVSRTIGIKFKWPQARARAEGNKVRMAQGQFGIHFQHTRASEAHNNLVVGPRFGIGHGNNSHVFTVDFRSNRTMDNGRAGLVINSSASQGWCERALLEGNRNYGGTRPIITTGFTQDVVIRDNTSFDSARMPKYSSPVTEEGNSWNSIVR